MKVIKFSAEWCNPCKVLKPMFEGLKRDYPGLGYQKVDIEKEPNITNQYGIMSVPTLVVLDGDTEVGRATGIGAIEQLSPIIKELNERSTN